MIPFSGSDTEVKSWTCLVHDLPIDWSGLTQNTLDLSTLNTDLAPDCHVVGCFFFYCIHFCLVGIASFCKLCKRQFEVNSFGFFHVFLFQKWVSTALTKYDKTLSSELDVKCSSTIYTVLHLAVYWETMSSLFKFLKCLNYTQLLINSVYSTCAALARWMQVTRPAYRV